MMNSKQAARYWIKQQPLMRMANPVHLSDIMPSVLGLKVGAYYPLHPEVDCMGLLTHWRLHANACIYFPEVLNHGFIFHAWRGQPFERISDGSYIPKKLTLSIQPEELDVCVVPCLAINQNGVRLGRGSGAYDRYIKSVSVPKWGLIMPHQYLPFAGESHDLVYDAIWQVSAKDPKRIL